MAELEKLRLGGRCGGLVAVALGFGDEALNALGIVHARGWSLATRPAVTLRENVVPGVSQAPGFVTGHWTRKDDSGVAMVVFESEEAAEGMRERVPSMIPEDVVTLDSVEVREVVANA